MAIEIPLTRGYVAIVDDCDADLADFKWYAVKNDRNHSPYAKRSSTGKEGIISGLMHRVILERILERKLRKGEHVDHVNGDGLDNRRENLRLATHTQNAQNRRNRKPTKSSYKGVRQHNNGLWAARITIDTKENHIGFYNTAREAGIAYNHAAKQYFGEFASFNAIDGWENEHPSRREKYATIRKDNKSGYPNINFHKGVGKWAARVRVNGERLFIGYYDTPELAHAAYVAAARELHGEFANPGTPPEASE